MVHRKILIKVKRQYEPYYHIMYYVRTTPVDRNGDCGSRRKDVVNVGETGLQSGQLVLEGHPTGGTVPEAVQKDERALHFSSSSLCVAIIRAVVVRHGSHSNSN